MGLRRISFWDCFLSAFLPFLGEFREGGVGLDDGGEKKIGKKVFLRCRVGWRWLETLLFRLL